MRSTSTGHLELVHDDLECSMDLFAIFAIRMLHFMLEALQIVLT